MFHNAAQMPVGAFCYGDKEQLDCLARLDLHSMGDMWRYIAASTPLVDLVIPLTRWEIDGLNGQASGSWR
jgi:hypothetical protein